MEQFMYKRTICWFSGENTPSEMPSRLSLQSENRSVLSGLPCSLLSSTGASPCPPSPRFRVRTCGHRHSSHIPISPSIKSPSDIMTKASDLVFWHHPRYGLWWGSERDDKHFLGRDLLQRLLGASFDLTLLGHVGSASAARACWVRKKGNGDKLIGLEESKAAKTVSRSLKKTQWKPAWTLALTNAEKHL